MNSNWQLEHGTWHPCGRHLGPVYYEQRVDGRPTGWFFVVPRGKYWLICTLDTCSGLPVIGSLAARVRRRLAVTYRCMWLHHGKHGDT